MSKFLLANITWNPYGWKKGYKNPKAGHKYARDHIPSESFNFKFNKIVDTKKFIYGFIEWSNAPIKFDKEGLIIFYTKNTDDKKNQLIGVYGKTEVIKKRYEIEGKNCSSNIRAEKAFSILFPIPLDADNYKTSEDMVVVGQNGFKYREKDYAKKVLFDELSELKKTNYKGGDLTIREVTLINFLKFMNFILERIFSRKRVIKIKIKKLNLIMMRMSKQSLRNFTKRKTETLF